MLQVGSGSPKETQRSVYNKLLQVKTDFSRIHTEGLFPTTTNL